MVAYFTGANVAPTSRLHENALSCCCYQLQEIHNSGVPSSGTTLKFNQNISTGSKLKIYGQMEGQIYYCHAHYVKNKLMEGKKFLR
jgi:hypothetical protein